MQSLMQKKRRMLRVLRRMLPMIQTRRLNMRMRRRMLPMMRLRRLKTLQTREGFCCICFACSCCFGFGLRSWELRWLGWSFWWPSCSGMLAMASADSLAAAKERAGDDPQPFRTFRVVLTPVRIPSGRVWGILARLLCAHAQAG